ncbi:hypothetical protein [uncultured Pseudosulfitobacter sp.]|uniref:hypothetical protein n=1 Tax=uncultured Pseudosulfitobacter sp. TaxID=2854214 RepID=UPI0030D8C21A|tara:strand:+ start:44933 stop:45196 length:264 start_codon:yes stop_codon:yes gene_type:complete
MEPKLIGIVIILPFVAAFIYAAVHEYMRYNSEGKATYGLVYDEETGTTHVTGIPEDEETYDPEDFDPNDYINPEARSGPEDADTDKS